MSHLAPRWALAGLGVLDAVDLAALLASQGNTAREVVLVTWHGGLAMGFAVAMLGGARQATRSEAWGIAATAFWLALFVPILGAIGLAAALDASIAAGSREPDVWARLRVDPDRLRPHARSGDDSSITAVAGALADRRPGQATKRFEASLRVAELPPRVAVRLLRSALKDPSEEVRLFAFGRIERMRADLERALEGFRSALASAEDDAAREHLRLRLAETHWEFAYLGLAEGAVLEHALESAVAEATESQRVGRNPAAASFLLGRILLLRRDIDGAVVEFERASRLGYPMTKVLSYLAECAFEARAFERVRGYLRELGQIGHGHAPLARLRRFWR